MKSILSPCALSLCCYFLHRTLRSKTCKQKEFSQWITPTTSFTLIRPVESLYFLWALMKFEKFHSMNHGTKEQNTQRKVWTNETDNASTIQESVFVKRSYRAGWSSSCFHWTVPWHLCKKKFCVLPSKLFFKQNYCTNSSIVPIDSIKTDNLDYQWIKLCANLVCFNSKIAGTFFWQDKSDVLNRVASFIHRKNQ